MTSKNKIKQEINILLKDADIILKKINQLNEDDEIKEDFRPLYQKWYTKSIKVLETFGKDRILEFKSYYEIPSKRTYQFASDEYVIQDNIKNLTPYPTKTKGNFKIEKALTLLVYNQYTILHAIFDRIDLHINDIQNNLMFEFQTLELANSQALLKINVRASGVLSGVILESHLKKIIEDNNITTSKKNLTLSDYNEILKNNNIIDTTTWKKILYLADIRNLCSHKKENEPTKEQVQELISGTDWCIKNI
ncbi:MAG: hypothetical protein Q7T12_00580 [Flavobacterium sp.]|nr:hypothetical protein [Flavobacterium sp.]